MAARAWRLGRALGMLCLLVLLWGCQSASPRQGISVRVAQAVSGQTLEVLDPNGGALTQQVRLLGIDAPDLRQKPWGIEAKEHLQTLLAGKTVLLEPDLEQQDTFGRKLAYVWLDGVLINQVLLEHGQAVASVRSPNLKYQQRLTRAQEKARLLEIGIWNPDRPMRQLPSEFRQQNPS